MKRSVVWGFVCLGLISVSVGCSNTGVVRGQNPGAGYNAAMEMQGDMRVQTPRMPMGPIYYDGPTTSDGPMACPPGTPDVWRPTHHHTWEYNPPKNLVYPPANQQPGVVQYPYYTCKGPTDFFYK